MPARHDLDPPAMTDAERRAKRRYQAGHAFEQMGGPLLVELCGKVMPGHADVPSHRCHRRPHPDTLHEAPATDDGLSTFAGLLVSWHDPTMQWPDA